MKLEEAHKYEAELRSEIIKLGKEPKVYGSVWDAIDDMEKELHKLSKE